MDTLSSHHPKREKPLKYPWIQEPQKAIFIRRINRFAGQVELGGKLTKVYLPNSGRLEELLTPGVTVILEKRRQSGKTLHDMLSVQAYHFPDGHPIWVGLDSRQPPVLLRWIIENQYMDAFGAPQSIKNEPRMDHGRFDLEIQSENGTHFIETKSVNLIDARGIARFPDSPTSRGVRHLQSLLDLQSKGLQAWIVFVVMRQDAVAFSPFSERDPQFSESLLRAKSAGVGILALKFKSGTTMEYISDLEVILPSEPFPGFWIFNDASEGKKN